MPSSAGKALFNYLIYFSEIFCTILFEAHTRIYFTRDFLTDDSLKIEFSEQNVIMFAFEHILGGNVT